MKNFNPFSYRNLRFTAILIFYIISHRSAAQDPVLELTLVNVGSNCVELRGTAIGNFTGAWNQWAGSSFVIRIPKSVFPMGKVSGFEAGGFSLPGVPDPEITAETNTGFAGITPVDLLSGTANVTTIDPVDVGGVDDGYLYFQIQDAVNGPNTNLLSGTTVTLFSFCLPNTSTFSCFECIELLTDDMNAFFDATGISTTPFIGNSNKAGGLSVHSIGDFNTNLPIELSFFDGASSKCDAALTWVTETEQNASHFEVQQSKDGRHFNTIGMVKAAGNSLSQQVYKYASAGGGNAYYRLKMVDADGTADFSDVIFIKAKDCRLKDLVLYPNPSKVGENFITAEVTLPQASDAKIYILDAVGKIHALKVVNLDATVNKISIETESLTPGMYWVRVELPNEEPLFKSFICQ